MQAAVVRVASSEDLLHKGEYVFIAARPPQVHYERQEIKNPNFFARLFGRTYFLKRVETEVWPKLDTIVLNCPECGGPVATTKHTILSIEPLTLDIPFTCPYCQNRTYAIKDGTINEIETA